MFQPVIDNWVSYNTPIEGYVNVMYCDTLNYVTTGMGNKIDPLDNVGLALPWRYKTTKFWATEKDIRAEFDKIKANHSPASTTVKTATLYIEDAVVNELIAAKLKSMEATLKKTFAQWDTWPVDAQFAVLSMSWSMGEYFPAKFPNFTTKMKAQDFLGAVDHCQIGTNPKARRNVLDVQLLINAAMSKTTNKPKDKFFGNTTWVNVAALNNAVKDSSILSSNSWLVQFQLNKLGYYTGPIDGLFGNMSKAAYAKYCAAKKLPNAYTVDVLTRLGKDSGYAWPVK